MTTCERVEFTATFEEGQPESGLISAPHALRFRHAFVVRGYPQNAQDSRIREAFSQIGTVENIYNHRGRVAFVNLQNRTPIDTTDEEKRRVKIAGRCLAFGIFTVSESKNPTEGTSGGNIDYASKTLPDPSPFVEVPTVTVPKSIPPDTSEVERDAIGLAPNNFTKPQPQKAVPAVDAPDNPYAKGKPKDSYEKIEFKKISAAALGGISVLLLAFCLGLHCPTSVGNSVIGKFLSNCITNSSLGIFGLDSSTITVYSEALLTGAIALSLFASTVNLVNKLRPVPILSLVAYCAIFFGAFCIACDVRHVMMFWIVIIGSLTFACNAMISNAKLNFSFFDSACIAFSIVISLLKIGYIFGLDIGLPAGVTEFLHIHTYLVLGCIFLMILISLLVTITTDIVIPSDTESALLYSCYHAADKDILTDHRSDLCSESPAAWISKVNLAILRGLLFGKALRKVFVNLFYKFFRSTLPLAFSVIFLVAASSLLTVTVRALVLDSQKYLSCTLWSAQSMAASKIVIEFIIIWMTSFALAWTLNASHPNREFYPCLAVLHHGFTDRCLRELRGRAMRMVNIAFFAGAPYIVINWKESPAGVGLLMPIITGIVFLTARRTAWKLKVHWTPVFARK